MGDLQRKLYNSARNGPVAYALSGLDIALWDIAGKVAGQPLYRMLGGAPAERVPVYASLLRYGKADLVERNAARALEQGYTRVKLHEITEPEVAAARRAIGPNVALMVDTNCPWTTDEAVAMAKRMAPHDLLWLEEPVWPPENYDGMARVRTEGGVAVGGRRKRLHHGGLRGADQPRQGELRAAERRQDRRHHGDEAGHRAGAGERHHGSRRIRPISGRASWRRSTSARRCRATCRSSGSTAISKPRRWAIWSLPRAEPCGCRTGRASASSLMNR